MRDEYLKLVNIGYGNVIVLSHIVGITSPSTSPMKRFIAWMREYRPEKLVDATFGNKLRSVIHTDSGFVFLSSIHPQTLAVKLVKAYNEDLKELTKLELQRHMGNFPDTIVEVVGDETSE